MTDLDPQLALAEQQLTAAERTGDRAALETLLAPGFVGVDMRGRRIGKAEFIRTFCDSGMQFTRLEIENVIAVVSGPALNVVVGRSIFAFELPGRTGAGSGQFVDCWQRSGEGYQLVASSVTREER